MMVEFRPIALKPVPVTVFMDKVLPSVAALTAVGAVRTVGAVTTEPPGIIKGKALVIMFQPMMVGVAPSPVTVGVGIRGVACAVVLAVVWPILIPLT